jgi:hypothetical protein
MGLFDTIDRWSSNVPSYGSENRIVDSALDYHRQELDNSPRFRKRNHSFLDLSREDASDEGILRLLDGKTGVVKTGPHLDDLEPENIAAYLDQRLRDTNHIATESVETRRGGDAGYVAVYQDFDGAYFGVLAVPAGRDQYNVEEKSLGSLSR